MSPLSTAEPAISLAGTTETLTKRILAVRRPLLVALLLLSGWYVVGLVQLWRELSAVPSVDVLTRSALREYPDLIWNRLRITQEVEGLRVATIPKFGGMLQLMALFPVWCLLSRWRIVVVGFLTWFALVFILAIVHSLDPSPQPYHWMAPVGVAVFSVQLGLSVLSEFLLTKSKQDLRRARKAEQGRRLLFGGWVVSLGTVGAMMLVMYPAGFALEVVDGGQRLVVSAQYPQGRRSRVLHRGDVPVLQWHSEPMPDAHWLQVLQARATRGTRPSDGGPSADSVLFWIGESYDPSAVQRQSEYQVLCELMAAELNVPCAEPRVWPLPEPLVGCASD